MALFNGISLLNAVVPKIMEQIRAEITSTNTQFPIILQTTIKAMCNKLCPDEEKTYYKSFRTNTIGELDHIANDYEQLEKILRNHLDERIEETTTNEGDSQTGIIDVTDYRVRFWEYRPSIIRKVNTVYAKGNGYIETPEWLQHRKAIINIKNTDDQCFIKCIYRAINYDKKNRNNNRDVTEEELTKFRKQFNCRAISDVYVDVGQFEDDNPSISIDIYSIPIKEDDISLIYRSKNINPKYRINLGYLEDDDGGTHYIIITKLHLLFKKKYECSNAERICYWCKAVFRASAIDAFEKHLKECQQRVTYVQTDFWTRIRIPEKREILKFKERNIPPARFIVYADFESATGNNGKEYPIGYCLYCPDLYKLGYIEGLQKNYNEDEEKLIGQLCKHLKKIYSKAFYNLHRYLKLKSLTPEQEMQFQKADRCERCKQEFTASNRKCRHHDHVTGDYIGAYCNSCNLKIRYVNFKVRVVFHNFKTYDGHFIIRLALKVLNVPSNYQFMIGSSNEQLSYIQYDNFIFMDSAQHLKDSLDNLVSTTPKDKFHNFEYLKLDKALLRKGVFPYEYIDSFDKLKETKLPPKECFRSTLKNADISDEEYKYAQHIWDIM
jgi:hypothetical protein